MEVRPATIEDCEAMARAMKVVVDEGRWLATEPSASTEELEARFRHAIEEDEHLLLTLLEGAEPIGALGLNPTQAPGVRSLGMWVAPQWRGQGGGRALLEAALAALPPEVHKIELEVFPDNAPAIASIARWGSSRRACGAITTAASMAPCARPRSWPGCSR